MPSRKLLYTKHTFIFYPCHLKNIRQVLFPITPDIEEYGERMK